MLYLKILFPKLHFELGEENKTIFRINLTDFLLKYLMILTKIKLVQFDYLKVITAHGTKPLANIASLF